MPDAVISRRSIERFTPAHYEGDSAAPSFKVAPLGHLERTAFHAHLTREGIRYHSDADVIAAIRAAVEEEAPHNMDALLATIDAFDAVRGVVIKPPKPSEEGGAIAQEDQDAYDQAQEAYRAAAAAFQEVQAALSTHHRVRPLVADRTRFNAAGPIIAAMHALRGWEGVVVDGVPVPFARRDGLVPEELLDAVDERDLVAVGWRAWSLMRVGETARKN